MDTARAAALTGPLRDHYVTLLEAEEATYREQYRKAE
jgi:hypothetical protein